MRTAVIILGHGSRRQGAGDPVAGIADAMKASGGYAAAVHAFLQYAPPSLPDAVSRCVEQGAGRIVIVPFFVQPGNHVTTDIPELVEALRKKHPGVLFSVTGHVGGYPIMVKIVEDLVVRSIAECGVRNSE